MDMLTNLLFSLFFVVDVVRSGGGGRSSLKAKAVFNYSHDYLWFDLILLLHIIEVSNQVEKLLVYHANPFTYKMT